MATTPHKQPIKSSTKSLKAAKPVLPPDPAEQAAMIAVDGVPQFNAVSLDKRYVPARLPTGKVIEVWGDAVMRTPEGEVHPLRPGDEVRKGDVILTSQNGIVQMEIDGSRSARLPFGSDLQGPLAQVNATDQFDAPGAGPGDLGSLSDGLRVDRVNETVTGQDFRFASASGDGNGLGEITPNGGLLDAGNQRPDVDVQNIEVPESGIVITAGVQPAAVSGLPGFAVFVVHLNSPAIDPVTLGLTLTAGTALLNDAAQGGDFGSSGPFQGMEVSTDDGVTWIATDQVAVPTGATQALVRVPLHNDTLDEFNETFTLTARSLPGSTQTVSVIANATILDDDDAPTAGFTVGAGGTADTSVPEGAGQAEVTVTLSAPSGKPISIDWATADGTAIAGQDYTRSTGTLVFAPGETNKTISIPITNDKLVEPNENFTVNLSNGVNVNLGQGAAALTVANVTIVNDDNAPLLVPQTPAAGDEDTTQTGNVLDGATDADGDAITIVNYTVGNNTVPAGTPTTLPGVGTIVVNPGGGYSFTPEPNYNGTVPPVTFNATDGTNVTPGAIQLVIAPVNDAPVLVHQTPPPQLEDTVQTGNVLTGATDIERDPITVVDFTVGGGLPVAAEVTTSLPGVGDFVVNSDGSFVFTPALNYDGAVPQITFRATDGKATVGGDIQLSITPVNDAPVVSSGATAVSEEGLVGGLADTVGTLDTTNLISRTGQLAVSDVEGDAVTLSLVAPTSVTSNGKLISWLNPTTADGVANLQTLVGVIDGKVIATATIDNAGNYKFDLATPIDHATGGAEDSRTISFGVRASDEGTRASGLPPTLSNLVVSVEDDSPAFDIAQRTSTVQTINTNLLVVLDTSDSMGEGDGISNTSRLESAVNSITNMLDRYDRQGDVAVRLVTFADQPSDSGVWLDVTAAKAALATVVANGTAGNSNFHLALAAAKDGFGTGNIAGAQNISYFLSDGLPTVPFGSALLTPAEITTWTNFVSSDSNPIKSVAIGLGTGAELGQLNLIAFDGVGKSDTGAIAVSRLSDLDGVVAGTIAPPLSGFLAGQSTDAIGGADGGYVSKLTVDNVDYTFSTFRAIPVFNASQGAAGVDYTFDGQNHILVVNTDAGGRLTVDMDDGSYGYEPPLTLNGALTENVQFIVSDHDGDTLPSSLVINVPDPQPAAVAPGAVPAAATVSPLSTSFDQATDTQVTLHASPLSDVFSWTLADAGQPGAPGTTHVVGFDGRAASASGDVLNLHDLLQGEVVGANNTAGNLGNYLDFSVIGSGDQARTTVQVSSHGGFADGQANTAAVDQVIVLDQFDVRGALGLDGHAANQQIIEAMLQQGKLVVDGSNA